MTGHPVVWLDSVPSQLPIPMGRPRIKDIWSSHTHHSIFVEQSSAVQGAIESNKRQEQYANYKQLQLRW